MVALLSLSLGLLLLSLLVCSTVGDEYRISNTENFTSFLNSVNEGNKYSGTTILLDSDISLSGATTEPLGKDYYNHLLGVFDGQGHVISNLKSNSTTSIYGGLFGFSLGLTIKNLVVDSSCTITSSYISDGNFFHGGIIGYCLTQDLACVVENSVNMANVTFYGEAPGGVLSIGGLIGRFYSTSSTSSTLDTYVRNCANYGTVTHSGTSQKTCIGGIIGETAHKQTKYVHNCINYGVIAHTGTTSNEMHMGGIIGNSYTTYIENCLSAGRFSLEGTISYSYPGSIVGVTSQDTYINYCYWTSDLTYKSWGSGKVTDTTGTPDHAYEAAAAVASLNDRVTQDNNWNKWLLNTNKVDIAFTVNHRSGISFSSQVILFPNLAENGNLKFKGWYNSADYNELLQLVEATETMTLHGLYGIIIAVAFDSNGGSEASFASKDVASGISYGSLPNVERPGYDFVGWFTDRTNGDHIVSESVVGVTQDQTLYAHWNPKKYSVTFDLNGGHSIDKSEIEVTYESTYGELPEPTRTGYTFCGWFTEPVDGLEVTSEAEVKILNNTTLYAHWSINSYNVTFDSNGGDEIDVDKIIVTYNSTYGDLPGANRSGYMFMGWFTEANESVTSKTLVKTPRDHTLYAHWAEVTKQVEIVFGTKDITKGDLEVLVRKYTDEGYEIIKFEYSDDGETRVIIEFADITVAEELVRSITEEEDPISLIKLISFKSKELDESGSCSFFPVFLSYFLF